MRPQASTVRVSGSKISKRKWLCGIFEKMGSMDKLREISMSQVFLKTWVNQQVNRGHVDCSWGCLSGYPHRWMLKGQFPGYSPRPHKETENYEWNWVQIFTTSMEKVGLKIKINLSFVKYKIFFLAQLNM